MSNQEQLQSNQESNVESQKSAAEQIEKLDNNIESNVELSPRDIETRAEKARQEVLETAIASEAKGKKAEKSKSSTSSAKYNGSIGKKQRDESYKRTIKRVQGELSSNEKVFSKIIHNKSVEKISDITGSTIARPDAILSGAIVSFVLTLITYTIAKTIGYTLSGFETIAAFIVGWLIGILYDYLKAMLTGKRS